MNGACPRMAIAGTQSGVGKTSLSIGLARALTRKGLRVQTFKVGPDFLDPTYLAMASGRPCYNLDSWMCGKGYVLELFQRKIADADIAIIEGVMGLFDGASPDTLEGSTAELAQWLEAPVILVANARGAARSFAAMIKGFHTFEPGLSIAGVIANQCGSERHAAWLAEALRSASQPPLVGAVPQGSLLVLPSRHIGLVTADKTNLNASTLNALADALEQYADLEAIFRIAGLSRIGNGWGPEKPDAQEQANLVVPENRRTPAIGIAFDKAFHFYYPDNLEALAAASARMVRFSPLADAALPDNLDALYFGGGYPEEHASELSANTAMLEAVRQFAASGGAVYGECGGLMYLAQGVETLDGRRYPMAGVLPAWTRMRAKRKALGYVEVKLVADGLLGKKGDCLRGHEFHYSELIEPFQPQSDWQPAYEVRYRRQPDAVREGFLRGRILASYAHLHFGSQPKAARCFIECARRRNLS